MLKEKIGLFVAWVIMTLAAPHLPEEDMLPPEININVSDATYGQGEYKYYRDINGATIDISVTEDRMQDTGIKYVSMEINGQLYVLFESEESTDSYYYSFAPLDYTDGSDTYYIAVHAIDQNDNEVTSEIYICIDNSAPTFLGAALSNNVMPIYNENEEIPELVESEYIVVGEDAIFEILGDDNLSGLASIEYYMELEGEEYDYEDEEFPLTNFINANSNEAFLIDIPSDIRGRLFFRLYDNAGNISEWITTKTLLTESEEKFLESANINISLPATDCKNAYGNNLYNKDVNVSIELSEGFGGIENGLYEIYKDNKLIESGSLELDSRKYRGNILESCLANIGFTDEARELTLTIKLKAKSGYMIEKSVTFGIDKTSPVVSMYISGGQHDSEYTNYYNTDVEINFSVEDINLDADRIKLMKNADRVLNTDMSQSGDSVTGHINISEDGYYDLNLSVTDRAGNEGENISLSFFVDKHGPVIRVTYLDNEDLAYINHSRKALVEIIDDSPEPSRVVVTNDLGNQCSINRESGLQLLFDADGFYSYHIEAWDRAGNQSETYFEKGFAIDTLAPSIVISGLEEGKSYNGSVEGFISIEDTNIDINSVKAFLIYDDTNEKVELPITYSGGNISINMDNLPYERAYNGHYTIVAEASDYADNISNDSKSFIVNRFGSWYSEGLSLSEYKNNYLCDVKGIHIYEYNVDKLEEKKIDITYNGEKLELDAEDYTFSVEYNDNYYTYDYYIEDSVFSMDGSYRITTSSIDRAGNVNISSSKDNLGNIGFIVDRTAPLIMGVNLASGQRINEQQVPVKFIVRENAKLSSITVTVNDERIAEYIDDSPEEVTFSLYEQDDPQHFMIKVVDMAGNESVIEVHDLKIKTTILYKLFNYYNVPLGSFLDIIGVVGLVAVRRKRRLA